MGRRRRGGWWGEKERCNGRGGTGRGRISEEGRGRGMVGKSKGEGGREGRDGEKYVDGVDGWGS